MKNDDKVNFVMALGNALRMFSREPIAAMRYGQNDKGDEMVRIEYENGNVVYQDVTADSCLAIMQDVYKALL